MPVCSLYQRRQCTTLPWCTSRECVQLAGVPLCTGCMCQYVMCKNCASLYSFSSVYSVQVSQFVNCIQYTSVPVQCVVYVYSTSVHSVPVCSVCQCVQFTRLFSVQVYTVCQCASVYSVYIKPVCQCSDWWEHTAVGSSPVREMDGKRSRFGTWK